MRSKLLIGLSILFILLANFSFWISNTIYNSENFKNNVINTFEKQEVRDAIAGSIVERVLEENPGLRQIASSPAQSAISGILGSPFLEPVISRVAARFQNYIATGQEEVSLDLAPINNIITAIARVTGGQTEAPEIRNTNIVIFPANAFPNLNKWLKPITTLGPILGLAGLVFLGWLIFTSADKRISMKMIGGYLTIGTILNILLVFFVSSLIPQYISDSNAAVVAREAFNTFSQSYLLQLLVILILGIALIIFGYWPKLVTRFRRSV